MQGLGSVVASVFRLQDVFGVSRAFEAHSELAKTSPTALGTRNVKFFGSEVQERKVQVFPVT